MSVLPNLIHRFNAIPMKISASCFVDLSKLILKFIWRGKRVRITNATLKEKNEAEGLTLLNFKTYCRGWPRGAAVKFTRSASAAWGSLVWILGADLHTA
uniref:Uncharacterized protein n=1 Tax=Equus asinus TaxID=9793 RepID=A0A9L0J6P8_EQUAS